MTPKTPREKLELIKNDLKSRAKLFEVVENEICDDDHLIAGPRNDIEYQSMIKELKETKNEH